MITEDQLEQLAVQWFQNTGWNYVHGAVIAPEGVAAEREDFRAVVLKGRLAEAVRRLNPKLPESAVEEVVHVVTKPEHSMGRPFRAWNPVRDWTQGVALGCLVVPRWGVCNSQGFLVSLNQIKRRLNP
jgi:hypothetical protein